MTIEERIRGVALIREHLAHAPCGSPLSRIWIQCATAQVAEELRLELTPPEQARVIFLWPGKKVTA